MTIHLLSSEIVVDNFAGGGGASTGIEMALGRPVDIAINHDPVAVAMHAANHPGTRHLCQNVWRADPQEVVAGRKVGLGWFSPDCKHFSKAKGAAPVARNIRDLAWVVVNWQKRVRPRIVMLENVEEFRTWGPIDLDGNIIQGRKGETFKKWVKAMQYMGYQVGWEELRACDYGAPTIRKRLFLVARCDGEPIVFPEPTHGPGLLPYLTAADIIDWSIPCPSIFERPKPLADATCRRIAAGIVRYVINAAEPFIVPVTHQGGVRIHDINEPLRTVTTAQRGEFALVAPSLIQMGYGERPGQAPRVLDLGKPLGTVVSGGNKFAMVAAFLAQHNTGMVGHDAREPVSTITQAGTQQNLVTSHLINLKGSDRRDRPVTEPAPTVCAGGGHLGEVCAFLTKYYGAAADGQAVNEPLHTVTSKPRFGLVTVNIGGEPYAIADIGMRMLTPRELFRAQSFPDTYRIDDFEVNGKRITKTAQVSCCGNSVPPVMAKALVEANLGAAVSRDAAIA